MLPLVFLLPLRSLFSGPDFDRSVLKSFNKPIRIGYYAFKEHTRALGSSIHTLGDSKIYIDSEGSIWVDRFMEHFDKDLDYMDKLWRWHIVLEFEYGIRKKYEWIDLKTGKTMVSNGTENGELRSLEKGTTNG